MIVGAIVTVIAGAIALLAFLLFADRLSGMRAFDSLSPDLETTYYSISSSPENIAVGILIVAVTIAVVVITQLKGQ